MLLRILVYIFVLFLLILGVITLTVMTLGWIDEARVAECPEHDPDPEGATAKALWNRMARSEKYGEVGSFDLFSSNIQFPEEIIIENNNKKYDIGRSDLTNGAIAIVYTIKLSCGKTKQGVAVVSRCGSVEFSGFETTCIK